MQLCVCCFHSTTKAVCSRRNAQSIMALPDEITSDKKKQGKGPTVTAAVLGLWFCNRCVSQVAYILILPFPRQSPGSMDPLCLGRA
eukprot:1140278-Pelagomonas_calceolata.AAC.2